MELGKANRSIHMQDWNDRKPDDSALSWTGQVLTRGIARQLWIVWVDCIWLTTHLGSCVRRLIELRLNFRNTPQLRSAGRGGRSLAPARGEVKYESEQADFL